MKQLATSIEIAAPVSAVWDLLTEFDHWPAWGASIRRVESGADRVAPGVTGRVQTILRFWVPFEISDVAANHSRSWRVAGIPATGHFISATGKHRCRVDFTVALLSQIRFRLCRLGKAKLDGLDLTGCDLEDSSLVGTTLVGTRLDSAVLDGVDWKGADLSGASLKNASCRTGDFSGARLEGTDLRGALDAAYDGINRIRFKDAYWRKDIGHRAL